MEQINLKIKKTFFFVIGWLSRTNNSWVWLVQYAIVVVTTTVVATWGWSAPGWLVWVTAVALPGGYAVGVARGGIPAVVAWWVSLVGATVLSALAVGANWTHGRVGAALLLDGVNLPYLVLTATLMPVVVLASVEPIRKNQAAYYGWVLLLTGLLGLVFCVEDFLTFYVLFEVLGFPMFLLIGQYGPRRQRVGAAYKFFVYTFAGSAFILPVLVYLQFWLGSTNLAVLQSCQFTEYEQLLFLGLCCVPFAVKIPLIPFHLWLPEAHVEAPTPISMLLAGLLLKTGGYAFLRFLIPVFPVGAYLWGPLLSAVGLFSVGAASLYALVQVDMKRLIAYASVAHMSLVFLGLFSGVTLGQQGATYLMLAHGYTSAGLFAGIGVLYDRYHTRTIRYYGGVAALMPGFAILFFLLTLGNFSFPFTGGFTGEFLILTGLAFKNWVTVLLCGTTVLLSVGYSVWLFNRLFYGAVSPHVEHHQEVTPIEVTVLVITAGATLGLGWGGGRFVNVTQACYTYGLTTWWE